MTDFMREVLLHDEMLAIHQDALARPGGRIAFADDDYAGAAHHPAAVPPATSCSVSLTSQHSHIDCVADRTYGCYDANQSMWTTGGCRGVFECDGVDGVQCDRDGGKLSVCPCKSGPATGGVLYTVYCIQR